MILKPLFIVSVVIWLVLAAGLLLALAISRTLAHLGTAVTPSLRPGTMPAIVE